MVTHTHSILFLDKATVFNLVTKPNDQWSYYFVRGIYQTFCQKVQQTNRGGALKSSRIFEAREQ